VTRSLFSYSNGLFAPKKSKFAPHFTFANSHSDQQQDVGVGRRLFAHAIAFVGAALMFVGGFLATIGIPTLLSQEIAASGEWIKALSVLGVLVGLLCAILSYRATLKAEARP